MKQKIYVWCSLTFVSEEYRKSIENFKDTLRGKYKILDFVGLSVGTAQDVYEHDRKCVIGCDMLIADCSFPSIGLWYEIATAVEHKKKIILIAHKDAVVTRMILGIPEETAIFLRYESLDEVLEYINDCDVTK